MRNVMLVLIPLVCGVAAPGDGPVVAVTGGQIRGRLTAGGAAFQAIPFAAPPVGELRWREPAPVKPWSGVRDATKFSAPCAQIAAGWNDRAASLGSEDCLYLNVWTPSWPAKSGLPVLFWIHGGANMGGSSMGAAGIEPSFDGENLARRGAVVVTINYRLGMFGFFAHPELTAESAHHASGNQGLLDQIAALRWVRDNIAKFGGNPRNVTIFGQSAGALNVGLLMTSPLAKGLFHKAIEQSGSAIIMGRDTQSQADAEKVGAQLAGKMNAASLKAMRALSAADVLKASPSYGGRGSLRTQPNLDGYVLPHSPAALFVAGEEAAVPLIIGSNGREMVFGGDPESMKRMIADAYGPNAAEIEKLYQRSAYAPYGNVAAQLTTDMAFRCPADAIALWHSAKNPTYQYEFTRGEEPEGSRHSLELRYVFGLREDQKVKPIDAKLEDLMQQYWVNFARTGDPNGAGLPRWPVAEASRREYLELGENGTEVKTALRREFCDPYREQITRKAAH